MQTSALVLDVADDSRGDVLRQVFPTFESIPELVKSAHLLTSDERERLPDGLFALVMVNDDQKLRKYACVDAGNTTLSVAFFLKNAHKLPGEAQKTAAVNLVEACRWYDLEPPAELQKVAFGNLALTALTAGPTIKGMHQTVKGNLNVARQLGGNIATPEQMREAQKFAEVSGTSLMPTQRVLGLGLDKSKTVLRKTARMGHLVPGHAGEDGKLLADDYHLPLVNERNPVTNPQMQPFKQHLDVSRKEAPRMLMSNEKQAGRKALGKYPLDSYTQVKAAAAFFDTHGTQLPPHERQGFCRELVKRADELSIEISTRAQKYGSYEYAPADEMKVAHDARCLALQTHPEHVEVLNGLFEKRAFMHPDSFASTLAEFDRQTGLEFQYDIGVPDPYLSTFGKQASFNAFESDGEFSYVLANEFITEHQLKMAVKSPMFKKVWGDDLEKDFKKDPVKAFKKMPRDQKLRVMRMASDNGPLY